MNFINIFKLYIDLFKELKYIILFPIGEKSYFSENVLNHDKLKVIPRKVIQEFFVKYIIIITRISHARCIAAKNFL